MKKFSVFFSFTTLFFIFLIFFIFNYNFKIENFNNDIFGTNPTLNGLTSNWNVNNSYIITEEEEDNSFECNPNTMCYTKDNLHFGLYDNNCICNAFNENTKSTYNSNYHLNTHCNTNVNNTNVNNTNVNNTNVETNVENTNDNTNVDIDINKNEIEEEEEKYIFKTPCLNKTDDFDVWCRYYSNKNNIKIPEGMNLNSIGSKNVLVGSLGGCYINNGRSDNNSASAICDYKYVNQMTKLEPANKKIDYNVFTNCNPLHDKHSFHKECQELLKNDKVKSVQIMGYDCNPGFGRAKCLYK